MFFLVKEDVPYCCRGRFNDCVSGIVINVFSTDLIIMTILKSGYCTVTFSLLAKPPTYATLVQEIGVNYPMWVK